VKRRHALDVYVEKDEGVLVQVASNIGYNVAEARKWLATSEIGKDGGKFVFLRRAFAITKTEQIKFTFLVIP